MADNLGTQWRHMARVLRAEGAMTRAARKALDQLLTYAANALPNSGYDTSPLSYAASRWESSLSELLGEVEATFMLAWGQAERGGIDPGPYATRHLEAVTNRLAGVPDEVFDTIRGELVLGREAGEGIPQLAARVDALLGDDQRWTNRATLIARTEVIGANNAGGFGSAHAAASYLEVDQALVVKEWLATGDGKTRPAHAEANGQQVYGLDTPFTVDGEDMQYPGDPAGSAANCANCRCTTLYRYPGDPEYPGGLDVSTAEPGTTPLDAAVAIAAAATPQEADMAENNENHDGAVIVALPTQGDAVYDLGAPEQHATLLYFGDAAEVVGATVDDVVAAVREVAAGRSPFTEQVTGIEPLGDDGAMVWMLEGTTLSALHESLRDHAVLRPLYDAVEQFPSFTAHETIGYLADPEEPDDDAVTDEQLTAAEAVESITYDRLAVWWGDDRTEVDLTPEEAPVETDTGQSEVAAGVLDAFANHIAQASGQDPAVVRESLDATYADLTAAAGDPAPTPPATMDAGEPAPTVNPEGEIGLEGPEDDDQFYGVCTVEDAQTGDGRVFAPGAINWDGVPFPMPAGWQVQDAPGHDGSVICGRIDTMMRFGNLIAYTGTWDLDGAGWETRRLVEGGFLTGLSVDTDDFDAIVVDEDGNPIDPMAMMFDEPGSDPILLVQRARIRSWAMCRVPAFVEAFVANGTPPPGWAGERPGTTVEVEPTEEEAVAELVASAGRADLPAASLPPLAHYTNPEFGTTSADDPRLVPLPDYPGQYGCPITITDDRHVYGHIGIWGTCHIGVQGVCVTPPHSMTGYAHFLKGEVRTDGGSVPTGRITMETGHAADGISASVAAAHYDNTGAAVANVTCGEDAHGIWFSGRLLSSTTAEQIEEIRAAGAVSGDWRRLGGNLELIATLAVNVPGFPIPRISLAASGQNQLSLVAAGIVAPRGDRVQASSVNPADIARQAVDIMDRRSRAQAAQARVRTQRAVQASRRLAAVEASKRQSRIAAAAARLERV